MRSIIPLAICVVAAINATHVLAQPNPYGCHFFRNAPQPGSHSVQDRSDIDETIARSDTFDIVHYDINLDVSSYNSQSLQAHTTITYRAIMPGQLSIRFDLYGLEVDSVTGEDGPLAFVQDEEFLTVALPIAPEPGVEHQLTVFYGGVPHRDPEWGGFYFQQNYIYNLGIGISSIPPNFGKVWYPCFDSFVERATYTYHVKSSGTYRLHGQGTFLGEVVLGGDTVIRSYSFDQPIPTHLSAVAIANYEEHAYTHSGANAEIPVTLRAKPNLLNGMVDNFAQLPDAIDACEYWFGAYPFERVGYVHTVDGALEIPTNVAYPDFMNQQSVASNRALYTHELGHHWWGDMVTPYIHNDMWLKEGPAEYSGHLIEEWIDGEAGLVQAVKDNLLYVLREAHVNDEGFHSLSPMPDAHIYGNHTYYKGALVMHNLRGYMGDSLFRSALHQIQTDLAYTTITAEGFRDALEQYSGLDLDPFFDAWVFGPSYSVFEVIDHTAQQSGSEWNVQLQIGQKLRGGSNLHENVPLDLTLISASGEESDQQITVGGTQTDLQVTAPFDPAMIVLNRHARLNQARLDHEVELAAGSTLDSNLPYVEFRLYGDSTPADALVRVEHLWVAPDGSPLNADVLAISNTHYWNVDGQWSEGTALRGRVTYKGLGTHELDHELFDGNEYGMCILYRAEPTDPWEVYADQTINPGSLMNGQGNINITNLRKGQYAFGKSTGFVNIDETLPVDEWTIALHPNPAKDLLDVSGNLPEAKTLVFDIFTIEGKLIERSTSSSHGAFQHQLKIDRIPAGTFVLRVVSTDGVRLGSERFEVIR